MQYGGTRALAQAVPLVVRHTPARKIRGAVSIFFALFACLLWAAPLQAAQVHGEAAIVSGHFVLPTAEEYQYRVAQLFGFPPGSFSNKAALDPATGGGSFQGFGNIQAAYAYWSCGRPYTATYSGNVCDVITAAGTTGTRLIGNGAGGITSLVSGSACTFVTGNACSPIATTCASTCYVSTAYDQSGNTNCGAAACNAIQATQANRPIYNSNYQGGLACLTPQGTSMQPMLTVSTTLAQPYTLSIVTKSPASGGTTGVFSGSATAIGMAWDSSTSWQVFASTAQHVTGLTGSTFYAMQNVFDTSGAGSKVYANGVSNSISPGTVGFSGEDFVLMGDSFDTPTQPMCETAVIASNPGATVLGNVTTNQRSSTSGYNF